MNVRGEDEEEPTRAAQTDVGKRQISGTEAPADEPQSRRRRVRHAAEVVVDGPTAAEPTVKFDDSKEDAVMNTRRRAYEGKKRTPQLPATAAEQTVKFDDSKEDAVIARRRAYEGKKRTPQLSAIEAHDQAYLHGDVRNIAAEQGTASANHATPSGMPVSRQWIHDKQAKVSGEHLKRMIVEMAEVNKRSWSGETIAAATGAPPQISAASDGFTIARRTIGS